MKLTKNEKKELESKIEFLNNLKAAESSWSAKRLKEEIEEFGHERKINKVTQEIREYKLKELGI